MRISETNWMMVEEYLKRDDRCALPLGSTEQHCYLSLSVDSICRNGSRRKQRNRWASPFFRCRLWHHRDFARFPARSLRVEMLIDLARHSRRHGEAGFKRI